MGKRFTLEEAQRLIPRVESLLRQAMALKSEYDEAEHAIQSFSQRVMLMGGISVNPEYVAELRNRKDSASRQLRGSIDHLQELGCVVKDLDTGLVDFPTLFRGVEVFLCWKLGEPSIAFWHGVEEGFRGRKAIDGEFLDHHQGDLAQ